MRKISQPIAIEDADGNQLEPLFDEFELSRITGRSVGSHRRDRLLGIGCPYVKLNALVRYRPQDVRAYIERNLRGTLNKVGGR
jgi:hypothetical protein